MYKFYKFFIFSDAFEFYTRLTEQVDDFLKTQCRERVFAQRFEGVYSIQRICQDCPHRYVVDTVLCCFNVASRINFQTEIFQILSYQACILLASLTVKPYKAHL